MISIVKAGLLSCIGLIIVNILKGILLLPKINISNPTVFTLISQVGFLWFNISLWISLRYIFVEIHNLSKLKNNMNWVIRNIAAIGGLGLLNIVFRFNQLTMLIYILAFILFINYVILFFQLYRLDDIDLKNVRYLHNVLLTLIILLILNIVFGIFNEYLWNFETDFLDSFINVIPLLFLLNFLKHELSDLKIQSNACA